jgi:ABC-2 type transport system permease protein
MNVVFTALFDDLSGIPSFAQGAFGSAPWDAFVVPGAIVLVALLGAGYTSASLAADLRSGYASRMALAGAGPGSMLIGRFLFEAVRLVPASLVVLGAGLLLGAEASNGLVGVLVVLALIALLGLAFTAVFYAVAIVTEDPQTPFTMQPLGLPFAFLSSALVPIAIMPGWSHAVARINPVSVIVDAARHAMIGDLWSVELVNAAVILSLWASAGLLGAHRLLSATMRGD